MISTYYFTPELVVTKLYFLFVLTVFFLRRSEELVETAAIPSLKQLFTTAVAYKKKFKNGIISSWEDYSNVNNVSIF